MNGIHPFLRKLALASALATSLAAHANRVLDGDVMARQKLSKKLLNLSQSMNMKEAKFPDSQSGGFKDFDANSGNSFTSDTTYHSYVWDYCQSWIGGQYCQKWLDPYISKHGVDADRSPLEGEVWEEYQKRKPLGEQKQGDSSQYAIWKIKTKDGGSVLDADGKLDRRQIIEWQILPDVASKLEKIGDATAQRTINASYDESTGKDFANTMPNMESLRLMAQRFTKLYRNRLVANLGEQRVSDRPIEFALGEEKPDCDSYLAALRTEMEETRTEDRIQPQAKLDIETRVARLEERYNLCQKMRETSVNMVNPRVVGDEIRPGDTDDEMADRWRSRVNIALMDRAGINPNSIPKPTFVDIKKPEYTNELADWDNGARKSQKVYKTNLEQIEGYNLALDQAAQGMKDVAARSTFIVDNSEIVRKNRIRPGSVNLIELNGLTKEMKSELSGTPFAMSASSGTQMAKAKAPGKNLERLPSQLTVKQVQ